MAQKAGTPVCLVRRTTGVIPAVVRPSTSGRAKTGRVPTYRPSDPGARGQTADFHRHGWRTEPGTRATSAASRAEARELLASAVRGPLDDAVRDQLIEGTSGSTLALQELPGQLTADQLAGVPDLLAVVEIGRRRYAPARIAAQHVVEYHPSHVYAKLDVSSRTQLTRTLFDINVIDVSWPECGRPTGVAAMVGAAGFEPATSCV